MRPLRSQFKLPTDYGSMNLPVCGGGFDDDAVHRYVAGTMSAKQSQEFEIHLLTCASCQDAVRRGAAVRAALRDIPTPVVAAITPPRPRSTGVLRWFVPLAAAAIVVVLVLMRDHPLTALGRVADPPAYTPMPVRSPATNVDQRVDAAMGAYMVGDFARAESELAEAARERPVPGVMFFLGVSRLVTDDPRGAIDALTRALEPAGNAYAAEARFYLAKAWLTVGNADSALAHLSAIAPGAPVQAHARSLADSVLAARRR